MTIIEQFDGRKWVISFEQGTCKRTYDGEEFPFTGRSITGRDADEILSFDAAGNPSLLIWHHE